MLSRKTSILGLMLSLAFAGGTALAQQAAPAPVAKPVAAPAPAAAPARSPRADLEEAYKREFAFLEAEKNSLQSRLRKLEAEAAEKVRAAKAEIDRLQNQALGASTEADRLLDRMADAERKVEVMEEGSSILESTMAQADSRLDKAGIKLPEAKPDDVASQLAQVDFAFDKAIGLLQDYGQVRTIKGEFFGTDGSKLDGTVVHVGRVASYGIADGQAGPLAPAGEGRLKIWKSVNGEAAARAVLAGQHPNPLPLFIYDSLDSGVDEKKSRTLAETATAGGVIAWVLVGLGGLVGLLVLGRVIILLRAAGNTERLVDKLAPLVERGKLDDAIVQAGRSRTSPGRVLLVTLENLKRPRDQMDDAISEAIMREESTLDRFGSSIIVAAAVGPLLGLLGTVTGMIATFDVITEFGTGNPKLLSGGISEALITTEFGLIVAIPALLLGNLLNGWASKIKDELEKGALRVANVSNGIKVRELQRAIRRNAAPPQTEAAAAS